MTADVRMTPEELSEATQAAWDRLSETRRYLRSAEQFTTGHADCCSVAKARSAVLAEQRHGLETREATLVSLLDKLQVTA